LCGGSHIAVCDFDVFLPENFLSIFLFCFFVIGSKLQVGGGGVGS
jgi:hypothetical protein